MKSKAPLALMEQMAMILVFALAAALCLQAFVKSDAISSRSDARDRAVSLCQTTAEAIRHAGGGEESALESAAERLGLSYGAYAPEGAPLEAHYNADWTLCADREYEYWLTARPAESGLTGLAMAQVQVWQSGRDQPLFELEVAWQTEKEAGDHD